MNELFIYALVALNVLQLAALVFVVGLLAPRRVGSGGAAERSASGPSLPIQAQKQPAFYRGPNGITQPSKDKPA